jgi:hypothetical protein
LTAKKYKIHGQQFSASRTVAQVTDGQKEKKPTLRIFENLFCSAHLAHLPLPTNHKNQPQGAKSKEPNHPAHKKQNRNKIVFLTNEY